MRQALLLVTQGPNGGRDAAPRVELRTHLAHGRLELAHLLLEPLARLDAHGVGVARQRHRLGLERCETADGFVHFRGDAVNLDALSCGCLIEQVDRGIRQRSILQIALRQPHGGHDGPFADLNVVMRFVLRRDAAQDLDRGIDRRRLDREHAEAAQEAGVALLQLARAVDGRRSEQANFAAPEHRPEQIADAASRGPLAEQRVDAADVQDRVLRRPLERGEDLSQALLDFAAELRPRHELPSFELEEAELREARRHVARGDAHGESAHDGGLSHAGLPHEKRMVFLPSLENLQNPSHFHIAADDGVEAAAPRAINQVVRKARQHLARACHRARQGGRRSLARNAFQRGHVGPKTARTQAESLERHSRGAADLLREGVEQVFDFHRARAGLFLGTRQELEHRVREVR